MKRFFVILLSGIQIFAFGQSHDFKLSLEKDSSLIGDHVTLLLQVKTDKNYQLFLPQWKDTLSREIEILGFSDIISKDINDDLKEHSQQLLITSFDSGYHVIRPVMALLYDAGTNDSVIIQSNPLLWRVQNVKVDTTQDIKDIKAPLEAPFSLGELGRTLYLILAFILLLAIILLYFFVFRKKKIKEIFKPKPKLPPHQTALQNLEKLRLKKLWQSGFVKKYHSELTDILRHYLCKQWNIDAMEMTSSEILDAINNKKVEQKQKEYLETILRLADLAKFAKELPLPDENDLSMKYAKDFVESTKPVQEYDKNTENEEVKI